jgi:hypothetical protein
MEIVETTLPVAFSNIFTIRQTNASSSSNLFSVYCRNSTVPAVQILGSNLLYIGGTMYPGASSARIVANRLVSGGTGGTANHDIPALPAAPGGNLRWNGTGYVWDKPNPSGLTLVNAGVYDFVGDLVNNNLLLPPSPVTLFTPTVDTNFRLEMQAKPLTTGPAGTGCTGNATINVRIQFFDPDMLSGTVNMGVNPLSTGAFGVPLWSFYANGGAMIITTTFSGPAVSHSTQMMTSLPLNFRCRANTVITLSVFQSVIAAGCAQPPVFRIRPFLYSLPDSL